MQNRNVSIINYSGVDVLILDYTRCKTQDEQLETLREGVRIVQDDQMKLCLVDITGIMAGPEFMKELKQYSAEVFGKKMDRTAIVGMTALQQILVKAVNRFLSKTQIVPFSSRTKALDYLTA